MSDDDKSLDLTGLGKVAKAIPASSWNRIVKTVCDTFSDLIAPITETSSGLGRLIRSKFDGLVDVQKVLAADAMRRAKNKVERAERKPKNRPKSAVLVVALEKASIESDDTLRDIWANLIANEILENEVHPEFPRILERLSSKDAVTLAEIAESDKTAAVKKMAKAYMAQVKILGIDITAILEESTDFSREHLKNLQLIRQTSGQWFLTKIGQEFLKSVTDPAPEYTDAEP